MQSTGTSPYNRASLEHALAIGASQMQACSIPLGILQAPAEMRGFLTLANLRGCLEGVQWTTIGDLEITNVIDGRLSDLPIVIDNNRYSKQAYHLVAGRAPEPDSHSWHMLPYTSGVNHGHDNYCHTHRRKTHVLHQTAYELRGNLDSGSVNWSALGLHKILAHLQ